MAFGILINVPFGRLIVAGPCPSAIALLPLSVVISSYSGEVVIEVKNDWSDKMVCVVQQSMSAPRERVSFASSRTVHVSTIWVWI